MNKCFICTHPGVYNSDATRWLKSENLLCEDHMSGFLPPPIAEEKSRYEREAGEEG